MDLNLLSILGHLIAWGEVCKCIIIGQQVPLNNSESQNLTIFSRHWGGMGVCPADVISQIDAGRLVEAPVI